MLAHANMLLATLCLGLACNPHHEPSISAIPAEKQPSETVIPGPLKPEIVVAPSLLDVSLPAYVVAADRRAKEEGLTLIVYVGATWCEPCRRFHDALQAGQLNDSLSGVRFLEFDHDAHQAGLNEAGYLRRFVPLFAIPGPDGQASERMHEGAIKGAGAVDFLLPHLKRLLGR